MEERIICAAVWYKELQLKKDMPIETYLPKNLDRGVVFSGHRHGQCIYTKCAITGLRDAESGDNEKVFRLWHLLNESEVGSSEYTLCGLATPDSDIRFEDYEAEEYKRGGTITCPNCLKMLNWCKSVG